MRATAWIAVCVAIGACGDDETGAPRADAGTDSTPNSAESDIAVEESTGGPDRVESIDDSENDEIAPSTEPIDDDVEPCDAPQYWPYSLASRKRPVRVHYRTPAEEDIAREVVGHLEVAWDVEVDALGFREPLPDAVKCGPDGKMDVFLWRDAPEVYTDVLGENGATPWDDAPVYIVLDTIGFTAGEWLDATVAHEFNHACQAAYDWTDTAIVYEATATFIEDVVHDDDDNYLDLLYDFQGNPDWSIDRDDGYETWYMYGFAMYFHYLRERFFSGDARFVANMWERLKSPSWEGEPDFEDALDEILAAFGKSFLDSVVEFQRWRWYVGARDDGRHLSEAGAYPEDAEPTIAAKVAGAVRSETKLRPMMLGTELVEVGVAGDSAESVVVSLDRNGGASENDVMWIVQALPGVNGDDGEIVDVAGGRTVALLGGTRTLVVTALPGPGVSADPDDRKDTRYQVTLVVEPAP